MSATRIDEKLLRGWPLPDLAGGGDKEARGSVLVVAGCPQMPGAAIVCAEAVLRTGAGKLEAVVPRCIASLTCPGPVSPVPSGAVSP